MLSAQCEVEGQLQSFVLEQIRGQWPTDQISKAHWTCRHCQQEMHPIRGVERIWHFRHKRKGECPYLEKYAGGESPEHQELKVKMAQELMKAYPDQPWKVDYEVPLVIETQDGQTQRRIADVLLSRTDGVRLIVEVQLSQISADLLLERNSNYIDGGFEVWWAFKRSGWASVLEGHLHGLGQNVLILEPEQDRRVLARGI